MKKESVFLGQVFPLVLTFVIFLVLSSFIYGEVILLNLFSKQDILKQIHIADIIVGTTIYLKTSVDFAIFIGNLMSKYPGWKNRVAIEIGTAVGNAFGTMLVLAIWSFFREIEWLLAIMIFLAALVLFNMAEEGFEHALASVKNKTSLYAKTIMIFETVLKMITKITGPIVDKILPNTSVKGMDKKSFWGVFSLSFTIPFILGLDDFAGYVPLFNIVNVLGFSIGVLAGHMILNGFLFLAPEKTITVVKNSVISFLGSVAFILLALWGFWEVFKILFVH